jgi:hypothetical protein
MNGNDLDRWITGNYGEDFFKEDPEDDAVPGTDFDEDGDAIRQRQTDEQTELCRRLTNMLQYIGKHNCFDKADLLRLLWDCRRELEQ